MNTKSKFHFGSQAHVTPLPKRHIPNSRKKLHVRVDIICVHIKLHEKSALFVAYVKET
jgi:hypothetical protein